ncbi:beta-amyrin 11-oxidase-like isoform X2 [Vicia villosa]|uniref:beta-amyrin 11-oxidase-like isoform X2 n=1 Tax=Vicia villosa TaxID=3911 RepID=UPI00273ABE96|nr:beta-amyrin 11-oxidase-like isoform X2 [Vicia villosa]
MDIQYWVWTYALLLATYFCMFNFVWRLNEWYYSIKLRKKQYTLPPGDLGWPFVGNMLAFIKHFKSGHPDLFINNLVSKYGQNGIYKMHLFGNPSIIICEAEMCKRVLTDDETFKIGYPKSTVEVVRCKCIWSFSRKEHKKFRRLISSLTIDRNILETYLSSIEDIVINSLEEISSMSQPVEFLKEMKNISFNIIIDIFMGSYNQHIIAKIGDSFTEMHSALFSLPVNLLGFAFRKGIKAREKLVKLVKPIVEERRMMIKHGERKDLLDVFLDAKDEDGWKPEDEDIIDILIGIVLAGHESTANSMMWSMIYLTQNPHILEKAKIINETLRLKNSNFAIFREATIDVNINGYTIPKGWKVLTWSRAIHMNPIYYPNPNEFNPSRWNDHNIKIGSFLPFGAGSRHCPGSDLAKIEISIFLHYFLLNYKLELVNPKCPITSLPSPKPIDNCLAKVIKVSRIA